MGETGIHANIKTVCIVLQMFIRDIHTTESTVVYKEKQINLHNMKSVHIRILTYPSK